MMQSFLSFLGDNRTEIAPFGSQLLKWIGNKQRFAHEIVGHFPTHFGTYYEPFLGSGAVLATLAPKKGIGADAFLPLVEIWQTLKRSPEQLVAWYETRWTLNKELGKEVAYERIKASFNARPNGADLLFLCRSCYGGVVRFRKADGYMSTPCGVHSPISPASFSKRVQEWKRRCEGTEFIHADYVNTMDKAQANDVIYCDPPYLDSQTILYGAQSFSLPRLLEVIADCKSRGVFVALSIDGTKRSGNTLCDIPLPPGLFETEVFVNCGRSMLRRFQMAGQTLEAEIVADRLLLTHSR